ncbi:protein O-linked-mannose beta-1,2-N-acetylglucosaminyltransferase 1-like [Penaeus japonicus]|uniref:protein O-linked-mannose beta-1,2-N-acetylglucosaminyltransferase 1-like n=1 Tax=Penaeus japonicus TaxID=27405 RepID=UPI001C7142AE|nr:protein O-linked-mannose beta-1,2-N-acetylglucosaminyltransferase 1-like [Penaeus japonicus]
MLMFFPLRSSLGILCVPSIEVACALPVFTPAFLPGSPVQHVFNFFPEADKAIILEDDLLLAPDFLSFFQQTSWLLDADPSISLVNAYSQLSYPNIASDPTAVRRSEIYPQYGWMLRRDGAKEMLQRWIPESELKDWDWWLALPSQRQWKDTIVPEVSRTFHAGAAGAHVDGYLQEHVYNSILLNEDPHVRLKNLEDLTLDRYMTMTQRDIERAVAVNLTRSPCEGPILPPSHPGPFKIYVESDTKDDNYYGFSVLQRCLQGNTHESLDTYRGMMKFNIKGRLLYIVGCPMSPFW